MEKSNIRFRVRNKGGKSAGEILEHEVPVFSWDEFKNLANAEAFVKKAYYAAAKRIVREIHENINGTNDSHIQSIESLIGRSIYFSQEEIRDWIDSRNWSYAQFSYGVDKDEAIKFLSNNLPLVSTNDNAIPDKLRNKAADIVAEIADIKSDPIADYLWVKLTQEKHETDLMALL